MYYGYASKNCGRKEAPTVTSTCPNIDKDDKCPDSCSSSCLCMSSSKNINSGETCKEKVVTSTSGVKPEEKNIESNPIETKKVETAPTDAAKNQKKIPEVNCQSCGIEPSSIKSSAPSVFCDKEKCNALSNTCFYSTDRFNIGFGYCDSCKSVKSCSAFNYDKERCINDDCNKQASLDCVWDQERSLCYSPKV